MAVALSWFTDRLSNSEVPAVDGTPSTGQYADAVKDAVDAFNDRVGRKKLHTFSVVSGTSDYTMPDDFLKDIKLESRFASSMQVGNIQITDAGLIPLNEPLRDETALFSGLTLTLVPTPTYSQTRYLWYKAGHVLESNSYADMREREATIIIQKAIANAWRHVAARVTRSQGWLYRMGDVTIDKKSVGNALGSWVADYDREFDERVKRYIGATGRQG